MSSETQVSPDTWRTGGGRKCRSIIVWLEDVLVAGLCAPDFEGLLDEVIFLGFAATEREIVELMENGLSPTGIFQIREISHTPAIDGAAGFVELTWESRNGASYAIETSPDLREYEELTDGFESQGEETTFKHESPAGPARYYRLREE